MIIAMMYFDIALQPLDRRALDGWCWVLIGFYYCLSRAEALSNRCDGLSRGWGVHHGGGGVSRDGDVQAELVARDDDDGGVGTAAHTVQVDLWGI